MTRRLAQIGLALFCLAGLGEVATAAAIPVKAVVAQWLLERAFTRSIALHRPVRPWSWADMAPAARIAVPRLGVARIVIDTGSGQAMAFGPTLLPGGSKLGGDGTVVIAAHRDTHFAFLRNVKVGDLVTVQDLTGTMRDYRISGNEVVRADRFAIRTDRAGLALTTCWPFGATRSGPWRYVAWAVPR